MSQIHRSFEWLRAQWNAGGGGKRSAIVLGLLVLWPFVLVYGLVALVFEIIASVDRSGRFSTKAHWAIATLLVVGALTVVSAVSPSAEDTNGVQAAAAPNPAAVENSVATPLPTVAPTSAPAVTPDAAKSTEAPEITTAPTSEPSVDAWSRDTAETLMEAAGFSGKESPLSDGTPRWLGKDSSSSMAEVIGSDRVATVSMSVQATTGNGELLGRFANTWCPAARSWVASTLNSYSGTDLDTSKKLAGCSVHLQTLTASDGALVIVSIDRRPA